MIIYILLYYIILYYCLDAAGVGAGGLGEVRLELHREVLRAPLAHLLVLEVEPHLRCNII